MSDQMEAAAQREIDSLEADRDRVCKQLVDSEASYIDKLEAKHKELVQQRNMHEDELKAKAGLWHRRFEELIRLVERNDGKKVADMRRRKILRLVK